MKKNIKIVLVVLIPVGLFVSMFIYSYFSAFGEFYQQCEKIKIGMNESEARNILNRFILNNKSYTTTYNSKNLGRGIYVYHNFSGNRCRFPLNNEGIVKDVILYFE